MKIHQLSLFLENRPGALALPCRTLADAGVGIVALNLADTGEFGILRLIVADWHKGKSALEAAGCVVNITPVVAIEVDDRPGGLADLADRLDAGKVAVDYLYPLNGGASAGKAVLVFRFADPDSALEYLTAQGVRVVDPVPLPGHAKP